jgi:hypothetical protein
VGKPKLLTRQIETRFKLSFDSWNLISGQLVSDADHEAEDYFLVLLRVQDR